MILWPGGTGPYPAPPQLLFLCWGPGCSLLLSLTCSWHYHYPVYPQGQGWGWDFFKLLQESLGNTRMSHVCRLRVRRGRSERTAARPHCHSRHRSMALVWKGTGELPPFSACLPAPQNLPKPLLPSYSLDQDLYPWHAALHWVTSLLLSVLTLPGLEGFSGSRREGGWVSAGL